MALRYLIYSTGTTYSDTIIRESATQNPGVNESYSYTDFVIPEIQPLYLWRITGDTHAEGAVPNTDANISAYLGAIAPPLEPDDDASVGFVTGLTANKIDKVTGATGNVGTFLANGNLEDSGYAISGLTGGTEYNFVGSGGTQIFESGSSTIIIYSTPPSGTSVAWGDITGTLSAQTDLQNALDAKLDKTSFNSYTGTTQPVIDAALTGVTNLGTGTTLGSTSGRNVTIKSISVLGGLSLSGDANNLIISGGTGGGAGTITGGTNGLTTSGQNIELGGSLSKDTSIDGGSSYDLNFYNLDEFNVSFGGVSTLSDFGNNGGIRYGGDYSANYVARSLVDAAYVTGLTSNLQGDIDYLSGQTDLKLNISDFNTYSGLTDTRITDVEDDITILYNESLVNITGATNGLSKVGGKDVILGGTLTQDTTISGTTYAFKINTADIILQSAGAQGIEIIDAGGGDVYIESDGGTIYLDGNTAVGVPVNAIEISDTVMKIVDGRGTPVGMVYNADYSATFVPESLVTKRYVDSIATGLKPKASVEVASTANIDLSTGGLLTIDGYTLSNGDRVLVKDQTDASQNGIYSASTGTWGRTSDFDGNPGGEVVDGNIVPVVTGDTQYNTLWVLVTPDPIVVGTTDLEFTLFSSPVGLIGGVGINISGNTISVDGATLAGNSISWTGNTFNVDITSGTLSTALDSKLNVTDFNVYSGLTDTRITDNENDIVYLSGQTDLKLNISDFNTYSGLTDTRITDNENDIIYLSGQTAGKLDVDVFTGYTATTETRISGIEDDITYISGVTDTKLDESIFTGYTATTAANEIFLTHTGGTNINVITPVAIDWDTVEVSGTSFLWSGGSDIYIKEAADYEISYNIPFNSDTSRNIAIGANIIKNNATIIDLTAAASGGLTDTGAAGSLGLSTVIITTLALNDKLTLAAFRTGKSGTVETSLTGSILIKKKNTLQ